ncbi:hypothetical protein PMI07_000856 [Rhizobium sp. CF080]|uniref:hypothetical protein n=1 Tax=Rhizobium sp. (strain CF080) TaxID=1144310 RepID=UPI000271ACE6|nr:hypothetical protein [Rhizobium sp. CF080]EUB97280.1 hypothetical protein PMI07_000856 [Rhizobium sp. CF080]
MPTGLLIGPYARQVVFGRLKFWFAFRSDEGKTLRYEALIGPRDKTFKMRARDHWGAKAPKYGANFHDYRLPEDLSPFPQLSYPRFPRDKLADAAFSMVRGTDIADLTRLRIGLPIDPAEYGKQGDDQCTLKLLP